MYEYIYIYIYIDRYCISIILPLLLIPSWALAIAPIVYNKKYIEHLTYDMEHLI